MKHVLHVLAVTVAGAIALVPATAWTSALDNFVSHHPADAAYLAVATAVLTTVVKALAKAVAGSKTPPPAAAPGSGSSTMGAQ